MVKLLDVAVPPGSAAATIGRARGAALCRHFRCLIATPLKSLRRRPFRRCRRCRNSSPPFPPLPPVVLLSAAVAVLLPLYAAGAATGLAARAAVAAVAGDGVVRNWWW